MSIVEGPDVLGPFQHVAMFYGGDDDYARAGAAFIREGLGRDEPVMVAVPSPRAALLQRALGQGEAGRVTFRPMEKLGRNPAWIIPAWADFVRDHSGRAARGIGEPVWPGRSPDELAECARHETLLNRAFAGADGFTLLCPYDTNALAGAVLEEATRTHPHLARQGVLAESGAYAGPTPDDGDHPLSDPPADADCRVFHAGGVAEVRRWVADRAAPSLSPARLSDLVVAVSEAVTNAIVHGGGDGEIAMWHDGTGTVCEVRSRGRIADPLVGRVRPSVEEARGRGLWIVSQLSDLVQLRTVDGRQVVRFRVNP